MAACREDPLGTRGSSFFPPITSSPPKNKINHFAGAASMSISSSRGPASSLSSPSRHLPARDLLNEAGDRLARFPNPVANNPSSLKGKGQVGPL